MHIDAYNSSLGEEDNFPKTDEEINKVMSFINKSDKLCDKKINDNFTLDSSNSSLSSEHIFVNCEDVLGYD